MSDNHEHLHAMRHSLAHITASAVKKLWPEAKFGVGPVVENGFYYDIDLGERKISDQQFAKIEKEKAVLANRVALLDPRRANPDMVDELVRKDLGLAHPDEVIIPLD